MTAPIVFLDTETTGVHPGRQVWEVAMIRRDDQGEHEITFMVDVDLEHADPFGLNVGRFYQRHPYGLYLASQRPEPVDPDDELLMSKHAAAETVARWTHGAHIVGAVPNFDTEVLDRLLREHSLIPAWHYHLIDVENLAVGYLAGGGDVPSLPWKSDEVSVRLGVAPPADDERHTALGDARWAKRLYDVVMGGAA